MIKNILFDLGAVILEISLYNYVNELKKLAPNQRFEFDHKKHAFYNDFEKGLIRQEAFFEKMQAALSNTVEIEDLKSAWKTILIAPYAESYKFLQSAKEHCNLYLLSNTNQAHREQFDAIFNKAWGKDVFYNFFEKTFYSFEMQKIKPDFDIFNQVLEESNIAANETLFIDDNAANIASAKSLGFQTWLFTGPKDWEAISAMLQPN